MKNSTSKYIPFIALIFFSLVAMCFLVIRTPTLSFDDLFIAKAMPQFLTTDGWGKTIWWALTLPDVGQTEMRTYGLTRLVQLITVSFFGASPALTMGFVIVIHMASGLLIFRLMNLAIGDKITSVLLAIAWVASPAVIPTIRTEHHWLYLITPYYALIGWLILNGTGCQSAFRFFAGCALLSLVWLLGEAPVIPLVLVCLFWILTSPSGKRALYISGQALVSMSLLGAFLAYQIVVNSNPNKPHRLAPKEFSVNELWVFFSKILENAKGIVGLPHIEYDTGTYVKSFNVADGWEVWVFFAILLAAWFFTQRRRESDSIFKISIPFFGAVLLMWVGSIGIYFILVLFQATVFPMRYTTAFFLLMPIAVSLAVFAFKRNVFFGRSFAAVIACLAVAFSVVLTLRYEYRVNDFNREYIERMKGSGLIVYHPETPGFLKGTHPGPNYPGLVPLDSPGYGDPKKSFWTLSPMLELYAEMVVGSECRLTSDGRVEIRQGQDVLGIRPLDEVLIVGTEKGLGQICREPFSDPLVVSLSDWLVAPDSTSEHAIKQAPMEIRGAQFGSLARLEGYYYVEHGDGATLHLVWNALGVIDKNTSFAIHMLAKPGGEIIGQGGFASGLRPINEGQKFESEIFLSKKDLSSSCYIGIGLYPTGTGNLFPVSHGPTDWDGRRLLIPLSPRLNGACVRD